MIGGRFQETDLPEDVSRYLVEVTDRLMCGEVEVWQLPPAVAGLWLAAWASANARLVERNSRLEHELNRMYVALYSRPATYRPVPPDEPDPAPARPTGPGGPATQRHERLRQAVAGRGSR